MADKVIRFGEIDTSKFTVADMLLIEDSQSGKNVFHAMTELLSRHMENEDGSPMPEPQALKLLKSLSLDNFSLAAQAFGEAIKRKALPPVRSDG